MLVRDPTYYRDIVRAHPGRLYAMAPSREDLIATGAVDAAVEAIRFGVRNCGLHAIKFHVNTWCVVPRRATSS
jgi:hypothetical protein